MLAAAHRGGRPEECSGGSRGPGSCPCPGSCPRGPSLCRRHPRPGGSWRPRPSSRSLLCPAWLSSSSFCSGFPGGAGSNEPACQHRRYQSRGLSVGKIPWRRAWHPPPVLLPGESQGERSLAGCSPWRCRVRHGWSGLAHTLLCFALVYCVSYIFHFFSCFV